MSVLGVTREYEVLELLAHPAIAGSASFRDHLQQVVDAFTGVGDRDAP